MKNEIKDIINRAKELYTNNDFKSALECYKNAIDLNSEDNIKGELLFHCGRCTFFIDQYSDANKYFIQSEKYLDSFDRHLLFLYYYYSGLTNVFINNFKIAGNKLSMLLRNQTTEDELAMFHYAMSIYYYRMEKFDEMKAFCEKALKFNQNKVYEDLLLFYLARYYKYKKDNDNLLNIIKKYLKYYPDSPYFKNIAGDMYEEFLREKEKILKIKKLSVM